jgi:hypothetical protein
VEGNEVYNTTYGGPYISKASSRDLVVRDDFYKNVANRDPELARRHAKAGLAFAQTLSWDGLMPRWLEIIGAVTGRELPTTIEAATAKESAEGVRRA